MTDPIRKLPGQTTHPFLNDPLQVDKARFPSTLGWPRLFQGQWPTSTAHENESRDRISSSRMMTVYLRVVNQASWDSFPEPAAICPAHTPEPKGATGSVVSKDDSCLGDVPSQRPPHPRPGPKKEGQTQLWGSEWPGQDGNAEARRTCGEGTANGLSLDM